MRVQKVRAQVVSESADREMKLLGGFVCVVLAILLTFFFSTSAHAKKSPSLTAKATEKKAGVKKSKSSIARKTAKKKAPTASELAVKKIESESTVLWESGYSRPQIVDAPTLRRPASAEPVARTVSIDFSQTDVRKPRTEAQVSTPRKELATDSQSVVYIDK